MRKNSEYGLALQLDHEMQDVRAGKQNILDINERNLVAAGLDVHKDSVEVGTPHKESKKNTEKDAKPRLTINDLVPSEVKRRTGFRDLLMLLSYATVVSNSDIECLVKTSSKLTWLEEWVFVFEFLCGHTATRWQECEKEYRCTQKPLRKLLRRKMCLMLEARSKPQGGCGALQS